MHDLDDLDLTSLRKASRSVVLFHNYRSISYNTVLIAPSIDTLSFCVAVDFFIRHEQELSFLWEACVGLEARLRETECVLGRAGWFLGPEGRSVRSAGGGLQAVVVKVGTVTPVAVP